MGNNGKHTSSYRPPYLKRLDDTLATKGTRFLTGDTLCCFDCELMPKLQHIRVAGGYFLNFDLPHELSHLWQYVKEMYELDAFVQVYILI